MKFSGMKKHTTILMILVSLFSHACQPASETAQLFPAGSADLEMTESALVPVDPVTSTFEPLPAAADQPQLRIVTLIQDESLEEPPAIINRRIPKLEGAFKDVDSFNLLVEKIVSDEADEFRRGLDEWVAFPDMPPVPSTFVSGYSVYSANSRLVSMKLDFVVYITGAAHPFSYVRTVNYDLENDAALDLADVFIDGADYMTFLSNYCEQELSDILGEAFFREGLAPVEENFSSWGLSADGLLIEFDPYQVAPYASGPQRVVIPYSEMEGLLDPDGAAGWLSSPEIEVETMEVLPEWPTPLP